MLTHLYVTVKTAESIVPVKNYTFNVLHNNCQSFIK